MIRSLIRKLTRAAGYDGMACLRFDRLAPAEFAGSTHQRILPDLFALVASQPTPLYFLQIGANDGQRDDPFVFIRAHPRVFSALVEPQPLCLARLETLLPSNPRLQIIPHALAAENGTATLYRFAEEIEHGIPLSLFTSFSRAHLEEKKTALNLRSDIVTLEVPASRVETLLARTGFPRLDILACDIEGMDYLAVEQAVALRPLPRLVVFEHFWLERTTRQRCYELLDRAGYGILHGTQDAICLLASPPGGSTT